MVQIELLNGPFNGEIVEEAGYCHMVYKLIYSPPNYSAVDFFNTDVLEPPRHKVAVYMVLGPPAPGQPTAYADYQYTTEM